MKYVEASEIRKLYSEKKKEMGKEWDPQDWEFRHGMSVKVIQDGFDIDIPVICDTNMPRKEYTFGRRKITGTIQHNRVMCSKCKFGVVPGNTKGAIEKNNVTKTAAANCNYSGITGETALKRLANGVVVNRRGTDSEHCKLYSAKGKKNEQTHS